jgi:hypothetical protein
VKHPTPVQLVKIVSLTHTLEGKKYSFCVYYVENHPSSPHVFFELVNNNTMSVLPLEFDTPNSMIKL